MTTNARLAVHAGTGMRMRRIRSARQTSRTRDHRPRPLSLSRMQRADRAECPLHSRGSARKPIDLAVGSPALSRARFRCGTSAIAVSINPERITASLMATWLPTTTGTEHFRIRHIDSVTSAVEPTLGQLRWLRDTPGSRRPPTHPSLPVVPIEHQAQHRR